MMPLLDPKMRIMLVGMRGAVGAWMVVLSLGASAQYVPQTSYRADMDDPVWVQLLYGSTADPWDIRAAYEAHYADSGLR